MIDARVRRARDYVDVFAECLTAWLVHEDSIDARAGAFMLAESILMWRRSVEKR